MSFNKLKYEGEIKMNIINKGNIKVELNNIEEKKESEFEGAVIGEFKEELFDLFDEPILSFDYDPIRNDNPEFNVRNYLYKEIIPMLNRKEIPEFYEPSFLRQFAIREVIVKLQGYALVSHQWINPLADYLSGHKCMEIMCGLGAISASLQKKGIDIISTDNGSWDDRWKNNVWTEVEKIDAVEAIRKYGADIDYIIMSWAYMDDTAYRCLQAMREVNPNCKMIVIGEDWGGCTADDSFFDSIEILEDKDFEDNISSNYQNWNYINDFIQIVK